mgnify:CR=1 FL=1
MRLEAVLQRGLRGALRARAGVLCRSFVYSKHENVKPWALCFNASCAELRQRGVQPVARAVRATVA